MTSVSKELIQKYWDEHIHDLTIATHPVGTQDFFQELTDYRFNKLDYLPSILRSPNYKGKELLEIGCGIGIDLVCLARAGAKVTGIDLSPVAIDLAMKNIALNHLHADLLVMDGEETRFPENTFDIIYAHGVIQYTSDDRKLIMEIHRLLKPGGQAIMMFYNRFSWLTFLSGLTKVGLEHEDAPVIRKYSAHEVKQLLAPFNQVLIRAERFPIPSRLHKGIKARIYNGIFVKLFNLLPKSWIRPFGWHLMVFASKA